MFRLTFDGWAQDAHLSHLRHDFSVENWEERTQLSCQQVVRLLDWLNIPEYLTFIPVCHHDARHELLLAVGAEGVPDHDLLLRQLTLQVQAVTPVKLDLRCQTFRMGTIQIPQNNKFEIRPVKRLYSRMYHLRALDFCWFFSASVKIQIRTNKGIKTLLKRERPKTLTPPLHVVVVLTLSDRRCSRLSSGSWDDDTSRGVDQETTHSSQCHDGN